MRASKKLTLVLWAVAYLGLTVGLSAVALGLCGGGVLP